MVIFVGKFFGNMVISITTHWSFRLYGPFLAGPDVDHISGIDCIIIPITTRLTIIFYFTSRTTTYTVRAKCVVQTGARVKH